MKVITLLENTSEPDSSLITKHGLSLYIEMEDHRILFDTGPDGSFLSNAEILGINLSQVDLLVISHAHYDHGGGLEDFLKINSSAQVFLSSRVKGEYFSQRDETAEFQYVGLNSAILDTYDDRLQYVEEMTRIAPGITLLNTTEHSTFVPRARLLQKKEGNFVKDSFDHELILVIENKDGLTIFTGCSHNGIINMALSVEKQFPKQKIQSLVGGFHLMNTKTNRMAEDINTVKRIAENLDELQISKIYTGHCTGQEAFGVLREILGEKIDSICTGKVLDI